MDGLKTPSLRIATWPSTYYTKISFKPYRAFLDRLTTKVLGTKESKTSTVVLTEKYKPCNGNYGTEMSCERVKANASQA